MAEILEIVPYDPQWEIAFERERQRLQEILGDLALRIEHHGSTSVPGLAAKPVIDIQISVDSIKNLEPFSSRLSQIGYFHLPHPDDAFAPFFYRPAAWPHTHHLHLVESGGLEEQKTLAFRDYLLENHEVAREYEALKRKLALGFNAATFGSRQAYAETKGEFIRAITEKALKEGYPRR